MKILLISKYAATPDSGNPSRQYFFASNLAERGHEVLLVNSRSNGVDQGSGLKVQGSRLKGQESKLEVLTMRGPMISLGMNWKRVWSWFLFEFQLFVRTKLFKRFNPDIVIVSSLSFFSFVNGMRLKKKLGIPLVVEVRDIYPLTLVEVGGWSSKNPFIRIMERIEKKAYRNADLIISSLESAKVHFEKQIGRSVPFLWLPMGYQHDFYKSEPDEPSLMVIDQIGQLKSEGKFIVGYAGTIGEANALEDILALSEDPDIVRKNIHFVFIGDGPLRKHYKVEYASDQIDFFNPVSKEYLPQVLSNCDLLFNSWLNKPIYQYGVSPNKWIDYMQAARPILLALDYPSAIFRESNCGWQLGLGGLKGCKDLKVEILRICGLPAGELDDKGLQGKEYLLKSLDYRILTKRLEQELAKFDGRESKDI